jgi:ElaB/YqjD/DUF883 family membrane-anchored ribosome-binding protein
MNQPMDIQRDKLMQDLRVVVRDAEELLKSGGEQIGNGAVHWRDRTQDRLQHLRHQVSELQQQATNGVVNAGRSTNEFVQRNPWAAVGVASGIGLLAGFLMNNRR